MSSSVDMDTPIIVGFGDAVIKKNGRVVLDCEDYYDGLHGVQPKEEHKPFTLADAEKMAEEDPDNKWEAVIYGPLWGVTYFRRGPSDWVVTEEDDGFA
jgi:hypothetical protein